MTQEPTDPQIAELIQRLLTDGAQVLFEIHPETRPGIVSDVLFNAAEIIAGLQQALITARSIGHQNYLRAQASEGENAQLRQRVEALEHVLSIERAHLASLLPCPDCRDKVKAGECERCARQAAEHRLEAAERERDEAKADALDWLLCMDGVKHDPRCANHFMGDPRNGPCLRCRADDGRAAKEAAEATIASLRDALTNVRSTSRGYQCWCDASHNSVEYGHQAKCQSAKAALASLPAPAPRTEEQS